LQVILPDLCQQLTERLTLKPPDQFSLDKLCEAFVEPEVFLCISSDKQDVEGSGWVVTHVALVTRFPVQLWVISWMTTVTNDLHKTRISTRRYKALEIPIASKKAWSEKGQAGIFHAAVGKTRREHQHIVDAPNIGPSQRLGLFQEALSLGKLVSSGFQDRRLGPDTAPGAKLPARKVSDTNGNQVGWDWSGLLKVKDTGSPVVIAGALIRTHNNLKTTAMWGC
jgi:hypothetical protein